MHYHGKLFHIETGYVQFGNKQKVNGFVSSVINVSKITRFGFWMSCQQLPDCHFM